MFLDFPDILNKKSYDQNEKKLWHCDENSLALSSKIS